MTGRTLAPLRSLFGGRRLSSAGCLCLLLVLLVPRLAGELIFEQTEIEHTATFEESEFVAQFPFRVEGSREVEIREVQSSCGCTVPSLPKQVYAPGESGVVSAVFTYGSRVGKQHKTISVETDAGTQELLLEVSIPVKWEASTRSLFWSAGEARTPKRLEIDFFYATPVTCQGLADPSESFALTNLRVSTDGAAIRADFKPLTAEPTGIHRLELTVTGANGETFTIPIYLRAL